MTEPAHRAGSRRLMLARALAWALLLSGWVGLGSFASVLAPTVGTGFALVALWLLALGGAAAIGTRDHLPAMLRQAALLACGGLAAATLIWAAHGGGVAALCVALLAWAALTALASGVVRGLRRMRPAPPGPPIGAAALGALAAGLLLGDLGDLQGLAWRLGAQVVLASAALALLQRADPTRTPASRCRAGLFDCSLPAWPAGAWRDSQQWPALLAGLAMLPMMAALPLMVAWCRTQSVAPQAMVLLHFTAMFAPALLLRHALARWSVRTLSTVCAACLAAGVVLALWAERPWDLLGLAVTHGAAWGLAWAGQLWSPDRRSRQGASPLHAAIGYAALTLGFGVVVERFGASGVTGTHVALATAAAAAWLFSTWATAFAPAAVARTPSPPATHPDHHAAGR